MISLVKFGGFPGCHTHTRDGMRVKFCNNESCSIRDTCGFFNVEMLESDL